MFSGEPSKWANEGEKGEERPEIDIGELIFTNSIFNHGTNITNTNGVHGATTQNKGGGGNNNGNQEHYSERTTSWKNIAMKSMIERHPHWANTQDILSSPNRYIKGLNLKEGMDVTAVELAEVVRGINHSRRRFSGLGPDRDAKWTSTTEGPRFTRPVFSGGLLDQARLDRCYLSNGGDWINHVKSVKHDAKQALSDHWPVIVTLALECSSQAPMRRGSYFKMDAEALRNDTVMKEVHEA
ncbi:hypothetical protein R1sor_018886 [Riccia sorocarpa]|uniref:Uncharacterized protein n=1 Tax=Riccia sorocarpa TaxID=122646 RepID=A0ABD3IH81_9MARC